MFWLTPTNGNVLDLDPRTQVLEVLESVANQTNRHPLSQRILNDIRLSIEMEEREKGTSVMLYCIPEISVCNQIIQKILQTLFVAGKECIAHMTVFTVSKAFWRKALAEWFRP